MGFVVTQLDRKPQPWQLQEPKLQHCRFRVQNSKRWEQSQRAVQETMRINAVSSEDIVLVAVHGGYGVCLHDTATHVWSICYLEHWCMWIQVHMCRVKALTKRVQIIAWFASSRSGQGRCRTSEIASTRLEIDSLPRVPFAMGACFHPNRQIVVGYLVIQGVLEPSQCEEPTGGLIWICNYL